MKNVSLNSIFFLIPSFRYDRSLLESLFKPPHIPFRDYINSNNPFNNNRNKDMLSIEPNATWTDFLNKSDHMFVAPFGYNSNLVKVCFSLFLQNSTSTDICF